MNKIDLFFAKITISEVVLKTSINSLAVIERLEYALKPMLKKKQDGEYYIFYGSYWGNYFKIQGHQMNPDGTDAFPNEGEVRFAIFSFPIRIETSPSFYGRVFDDEAGSIIRGHFGLPFIILSLVCFLIIYFITWLLPKLANVTLIFALFFLMWSLFSIIEFIMERKAIIDFLKGLYFDVIRN